MSPRPADPAVRSELVDTAARLLAEEGRKGFTVRRLAAEVGVSTMAVYTHFGSMEEVRQAVRREGFARLGERLDAVRPTDDPVADLAASGVAYITTGLDHPQLYREMFPDRPIGQRATGLDGGAGAAAGGDEAFGRLVGGVRRCVDAGRFEDVGELGARGWAVQLWTMWHGMVSLAVAGLMPVEHVSLHYTDMSWRLFVGYGDDRVSARASLQEALF
ncbi:TetR/AcrR family transcriptional regulator [Allonocardiopsis opalescens]|uniref:TetR family transcriptional regulator n=1 Tax=Allonocardiopsis opalescens TaxID=1144618 RepID=A0A2T0Q5K0_9ACTN|nr:TetR/AcrR family transcriptional regulator [Allonocardiopsis opalescens]PRX99098.1 TetR family transcriptional regulator [Allonocardiopsis opalescens]